MLATKDVIINTDNTKLLNALNLQVSLVEAIESMSPRYASLAAWVGVDYQLPSTADQNLTIEEVVLNHLRSVNEGGYDICWMPVVSKKTSDNETFYELLDSKQRPYSDVDGFIYLSHGTMEDLSAEGYSFQDTYEVLTNELTAYNEWLLKKTMVIKTKNNVHSGASNVMLDSEIDNTFKDALDKYKKEINSQKDAIVMKLKFDDNDRTPSDVIHAIERISQSLMLLHSTQLAFADFNFDKAARTLEVSFVVLEMPSLRTMLDTNGKALINALKVNSNFLEKNKGLKKPNEWQLVSMVLNANKFKDLSEIVGLALLYSLFEELDYIDIINMERKNK